MRASAMLQCLPGSSCLFAYRTKTFALCLSGLFSYTVEVAADED